MQNLEEKQNLKGFITNKDLKEYDTPYSSFVGGWFIDESICDELVEFYNLNKKVATPGVTFEKNKPKQKNDVKESLDLNFNTTNTIPNILNNYLDNLQETLLLYLKRYRQSNCVERFDAQRFNIQWYKPGGGFKKWHCERTSLHDSNRHLVFMTYLNDVPEGGTEFLYQDLKLPAKKGLTVLWPSDWTHTHKGVISQEHEKYIITGWYNYI
jgi:hypothetical protein